MSSEGEKLFELFLGFGLLAGIGEALVGVMIFLIVMVIIYVAGVLIGIRLWTNRYDTWKMWLLKFVLINILAIMLVFLIPYVYSLFF